MKLYNKTDNAADKTILKARINILNEDIDRLNSRIQTCRRIICKAEKGEKEDWIIQKRFQDNKERSKKENTKNKDKKRIRKGYSIKFFHNPLSILIWKFLENRCEYCKKIFNMVI